jgi:hypothetical protein
MFENELSVNFFRYIYLKMSRERQNVMLWQCNCALSRSEIADGTFSFVGAGAPAPTSEKENRARPCLARTLYMAVA